MGSKGFDFSLDNVQDGFRGSATVGPLSGELTFDPNGGYEAEFSLSSGLFGGNVNLGGELFQGSSLFGSSPMSGFSGIAGLNSIGFEGSVGPDLTVRIAFSRQ